MYRKRNYRKRYHSDERIHAFSPIISSLKKHFLGLTQEQLNVLFLNYGETYGSSAYAYAKKTYEAWQEGSVQLSDKTLLRLVNLLPQHLPIETRLALLNKLFDFHKKNVQVAKKNIITSWDNYEKDIVFLVEKLKNNFGYDKSTIFHAIQFPPNVIEVAHWLCDDDMTVGKSVLEDFLFQHAKIEVFNACRDLNFFLDSCRELAAQENVYNQVSLVLNLPTANICITIEPRKKSILSRIFDLFN